MPAEYFCGAEIRDSSGQKTIQNFPFYGVYTERKHPPQFGTCDTYELAFYSARVILLISSLLFYYAFILLTNSKKLLQRKLIKKIYGGFGDKIYVSSLEEISDKDIAVIYTYDLI